MKKLLIINLLLCSFPLFSQTDTAADSTAADEKVYEMFDIQAPPGYPGGEKELLHFLTTNIAYPAEARNNKVSGSVLLNFVVNKDGSIVDVNILRDIGSGCGKEAKRVVEMMPNWTPGERRGEKVRVRYTLPVRFRL